MRTIPPRSFAVLACLAAVMPLSSALAQDASASSDQAYSYKHPSPTTITSFQSLTDLCLASGTDHMTRSGHALCVGYFSGIIDYAMSTTPPGQRSFCLPSDPPLTRQQARDRLVGWASANPAAGSEPAAVGVVQFLQASFPCGPGAP